jgi:hypothetical protein
MPRRNFSNKTTSLIYTQNSDCGFYYHPCLVTKVDGDIATFYAATSKNHLYIEEMGLYLVVGESTEDAGSNVLRLSLGSDCMPKTTRIKLQQRYVCKLHELDCTTYDVRIDPTELIKLDRRVAQLEVAQNRYKYMPLPRDLSAVQPGTVLMLLNNSDKKKLGDPVLVLENNYLIVRFVHIIDTTEAEHDAGTPRTTYLAMSKLTQTAQDGAPVLLLELDSPEMADSLYIEVSIGEPLLDDLKTWCWPPVQVSVSSMHDLRKYMADM